MAVKTVKQKYSRLTVLFTEYAMIAHIDKILKLKEKRYKSKGAMEIKLQPVLCNELGFNCMVV